MMSLYCTEKTNTTELTALLEPVNQFLLCQTPQAWIDEARKPENLPVLLIDHMICELKAAQTAMGLVRKYVADDASQAALLAWLEPWERYVYHRCGDRDLLAQHKALRRAVMPRVAEGWARDLVDKMVLLIKEELHHFHQVMKIMHARGVAYDRLTASRYAKGLMRAVRTWEPATLIDKLICGAYIEARSCERFARLAPWLDDDLARFYRSLLRSEARHYQDYLDLAQQVAGEDISLRVRQIGEVEAQLILTPDTQFRFHSGVPQQTAAGRSEAAQPVAR